MNNIHHAHVAAAAVLAACGWARASEIIVPDQMPLSVALAVAATGDTITIRASGSPYTQYPGFAFTGKQLTIRGETGNPADIVLDGAALDRVLSISGAGADGTVIRAITIRNGKGPNTSEANGAGLYISDANVTVENCIIRDNNVPGSDGNGAGLYAAGGSVLTVRNTLFQANTTTGMNGDGAAVFMTGGSAVFENSQFVGNLAEATLADDNAWGGAMYLDSGAFRLTRCTFSDNQAELGGAVFITGTATLTMDASRLEGNHARYGGGVFVAGGAAVPNIIRNTLILNNTTVLDGCAVRADKATGVVNCTIYGNNATRNYIIDSTAANRQVLTVDNTIIWGNIAGTGIAPISGTNAPIIRRGLVQSPYTVANGSAYNTVADPQFKATDDFHLNSGSPAIDAGDTTLYTGPLADFDLNPRGVDEPAVANTGVSYFGPVIDIGAYEFSSTLACYANCDQSTVTPVLNVNDFVCFMNRYAVGCP